MRTAAVVLATGASYRRLEAPGVADLVGSGIFYSPAVGEAGAMAGQPVVVVGGGNSAGQAAIHLSRYASSVSLLVRGASLAASMSEYLVRALDDAPNIRLRTRTRVVGGGARGGWRSSRSTPRTRGPARRFPLRRCSS